MDEAPEEIVPSNPRAIGGRINRIGPRLRRLQVETSMGPGIVVVGSVSLEHSLEVAASEYKDPVEALGPNRSHPPLGERVRSRGPDRRLDDVHSFGPEDLVEGTGELRVPVPDQEPDSLNPLPHH